MSSGSELLVSRTVFEAVIARAVRTPNAEIVGLLSGARGGIATCDVALPNLLSDSASFLVEPFAQFLGERWVASRGEEILALYHSHPAGDASFSLTDEQFASRWDCAHLIIGLAPSIQIRSYRTSPGGRLVEVPIRIAESLSGGQALSAPTTAG